MEYTIFGLGLRASISLYYGKIQDIMTSNPNKKMCIQETYSRAENLDIILKIVKVDNFHDTAQYTH